MAESEASVYSIRPGDSVTCRTVDGERFRTIARSRPFMNRGWCGRARPWLVVAVDWPGPGQAVNWPADVVTADV